MGLKKTLIGLILLILLTMPIVFALDTSIQVKTQPNLEVTIRALKIDGTGTIKENGETIGAFVDLPSGDDGIVEADFSSDFVNKIDISIMLKKAGIPQKFADGSSVRTINNNGKHIKTGWPVEIDITVDPPILVKSGKQEGVVEENTTDASDTIGSLDNSLDVSVNMGEPEKEIQKTSEEIEAETNTGITGKAVKISKSILTSKITYSILSVLILTLIISFVFRNKFLNSHSHKSKNSEFKVLPRESPKSNDEEGTEKPGENSKIKDAERKLEEAKEELEEVKQMDEKEEKIRHAREKYEKDRQALQELEKDKEELERLERE